MRRSAQFQDGYRAASKDAVRTLHELAQRMNDPQARMLLNTAADDLGIRMKATAFKTREEPSE
jgi:hypothetical protein